MFPFVLQKSGAYEEIQKSFGEEDFVIDSMTGSFIDSYHGSDDVIYVPERINGVRVNGLSLHAFEGCKAREIHLPDSATMICAWAFSNCPNLEKVTLPNEVIQLQLASFENCTSLKYVNLPSNIDVIDLDMFKGCTSLEEIHIPDGNIQAIKASVFNGCTSLKNVYIPQSVTLIGPMSFQNCT